MEKHLRTSFDALGVEDLLRAFPPQRWERNGFPGPMRRAIVPRLSAPITPTLMDFIEFGVTFMDVWISFGVNEYNV